ncbi:MAG TPA: DUF6541 family protein [Roseiflexaceae bacterium]|nr:DUF6541 family protein [Roseiflexaceae bacterium]
MRYRSRIWRLGLLAAALAGAALVWLSGPDGRLLAALAALLLCPGYLLERALLRAAAIPALARPALWAALSASALALLYQWVTAVGLALPPGVPGALAALSALGAAVAWAVDRGPWTGDRRPWIVDRGPTSIAGSSRTWRVASLFGPRSSVLGRWSLVILVLFGLTLWTRLAHVRDLAAPAWVDSLHHALLIRVAFERGQAPYSLEPYLPVTGLAYHSGYHVVLAAALGAARLELPAALPKAMLLSGQVLNALVSPAWAAAAAYLWRRPAAAAAAALVVGLASIMPAYYVSWGRYTLVLGVLMLPGALVAAHAALRRGGWGPIGAAALLLAGLSLVHFVVLCLALLWCAAVLVCHAPLRAGAARFALVGGLALVLSAPWSALLLSQVRPGTGSSAVHIAGNATYNRLPVELLWAGSNRLLLALAGLGGLLALQRRDWPAAATLVWSALIVLLANPPLFGLPYLSFFTNEFAAITLFAPASLLIAGGVAALDAELGAVFTTKARRQEDAKIRCMRADQRLAAPELWVAIVRRPGEPSTLRALASSFFRGSPALLMLALGVWLAAGFQSVVRPDTALATPADMRAVAWAARATPPDARFVVDTAPWLYTVDRGGDGGWWLLPLAGRQVSTPPVVFNYGPEAYVRAVKKETRWLRSGEAEDPAALAAFMRERGYTHVFATGRSRALDLGRLRASPLFEELYRDGDVSILRLRR